MKDTQYRGRYWLTQAERDLEAACYLDKGGYFEQACYQAQQAAEKAFKGFLYIRGEQPPRTHSVSDLGHRCAELEPALASVASSASLLDGFYTATRYPNALPGGMPAAAYQQEDSLEALALAGEVLRVVEERWGA